MNCQIKTQFPQTKWHIAGSNLNKSKSHKHCGNFLSKYSCLNIGYHLILKVEMLVCFPIMCQSLMSWSSSANLFCAHNCHMVYQSCNKVMFTLATWYFFLFGIICALNWLIKTLISISGCFFHLVMFTCLAEYNCSGMRPDIP